MSAARVQLEPAYLLSLRPYRETSALLEIFSATQGRVGLVAKGARAPKSKQRGVLQLFQRLLLSWSERGELGTLTAAEADTPPLMLKGDAVFSGWYLNELLLRLVVRYDPHPALFPAYEATLQALPDAGAEAALRVFERRLLAELGYGLQLPDDLAPDRRYRYDWDRGPVPLEQDSPEAYAGASLVALAHERLSRPQELRDAKRLLRAALARLLGDRPLETPRMLRSLRGRRHGADA